MKGTIAGLCVLALPWATLQWPRDPMGAHAEGTDGRGLDTVRIAEPDTALTLSRTLVSGSPRVLAVTSYSGGTVEAVDVSLALGRPVEDPVAVMLELGYDRMRDEVVRAAENTKRTLSSSELVAPLDLRNHHIAAGTNFPEHAGESDVEGGPFLFPKLVAPTAPYARVPASNGLLDYEVELAFVMLEPLRERERAEHVGLILCNDYTDRETLLRHVDVDDVESGKGFTTGKSFAGYLPVGNLLVVPRSFRDFASGIDLSLYVNGELRQSSPMSEAIWDFDELVAQTWARRAASWEHGGRTVALTETAGVVPARTLVLSGTPSGTVFQGVSLSHKLSGLAAWLMGGSSRALADHVIDAYVRDAHASGIYLQPGDRVTIHADLMGVIDNEVSRP